MYAPNFIITMSEILMSFLSKSLCRWKISRSPLLPLLLLHPLLLMLLLPLQLPSAVVVFVISLLQWYFVWAMGIRCAIYSRTRTVGTVCRKLRLSAADVSSVSCTDSILESPSVQSSLLARSLTSSLSLSVRKAADAFLFAGSKLM